MGRWNPTTRGIFFAPKRVAEACRRHADRLRGEGDLDGAEWWDEQAWAVAEGSAPPYDLARSILGYLERPE